MVECRNCGVSTDRGLEHNWEAICAECGGLLWLKATDVAECKVTQVTPFGILVELGDGAQGLIHISELADRPVSHPEEVVALGDWISAVVLRVDAAEKKIGLSLKRARSQSH